jgi:transcriptional regulator with XRE-family HTH domain
MTSMARRGESVQTEGDGRARPRGAERVGAALRQARLERGLSLEEVGSAIRSSARQVQALEEGRVGELPPHPFARGLVVACASHLGLDADAAAQEWGRPADGDEGGRRSIFRVPIRSRSSWRDWTVPAACAFGVLVSLVVGSLLKPAPVQMPPARPLARAEKPAQPAPEAEETDAAAPAPEPAEGDVAVSLRSEGATWVEVAADGEGPRRQELRPGETLALRARRRLGLALGDAGAVRITVNGRDLGFIGDRGEVRRGIVFEAPVDAPPPRNVSEPR